jgi:DNA polymerase-3 subunit gamma/tau
MADSHVLARKFRPQTFDQVIGQDAITRTLSNAVKNDRVHHAYIFTGARGVGKTTTARIFAKALNCAKGVTAEPCGTCDSCQDIVASRSMDVLEIDAASNTGVDNVRDVIINSISIAPARDRYKIFIIDEVHMLSAQAFNALLKTVEEPPPRVVFVLATTNLEKVPETILSRCQVFEFRTITLKQIVGQLRSIAEKEGVWIGDAALLAIARAGEGSMRDAESALDQVISFAVGATITDEDVSAALGLVDTETLNKTLQAIADQEAGTLVRIVDEVVSRGNDLRNFCREMMVHIRALLVVKIAGFDSELVQLPESEADNLKRLGEYFSEQDLLRFFSILTKTEQDIRNSSQPRFQLEVGLVKLAQARRLFLLEEALHRIEALESRLGGTSVSSSSSARTSEAPKASHSDYRSTGSATPTRRPAAPVRPRESEPTSGKLQARGHGATSADAPAAPATASPKGTAVAARTTGRRPNVGVETSSPSGQPPIDELYESAPTPAPEPDLLGSVATAERSEIDKIKDALEAKGKMRVAAALDKGTLSIEGDHFCVEYPLESSACKSEIEDRNRRISIEDACEQVLGRRLTLKAWVSGEAANTASGSERTTTRTPQRKVKSKGAAEEDPKLRALLDTFHGEVIEVIKPEQ